VCVKVHLSKDTSRAYALKKMKKKFIVDTRQQQHVMQEKKLLLTVRCPFIVRSALLLALSPCNCVIAFQFCCTGQWVHCFNPAYDLPYK